MATLDQLEQYEKLKREYAERNRRAELFPELVAALKEYQEAVDWYASNDANSLTLERIEELRTKARAVLAKAREVTHG